MLDFRVAQDSILVPNIELPNCQLRKLGYKLIYSEFNIVKLLTRKNEMAYFASFRVAVNFPALIL